MNLCGRNLLGLIFSPIKLFVFLAVKNMLHLSSLVLQAYLVSVAKVLGGPPYFSHVSLHMIICFLCRQAEVFV